MIEINTFVGKRTIKCFDILPNAIGSPKIKEKNSVQQKISTDTNIPSDNLEHIFTKYNKNSTMLFTTTHNFLHSFIFRDKPGQSVPILLQFLQTYHPLPYRPKPSVLYHEAPYYLS